LVKKQQTGDLKIF